MTVYKDIDEAYLGTLRDIWNNPDYLCSPRGLAIREKTDYLFKVSNPTSNPIKTFDLDRNVTITKYTEQELALYNSCSNKVEDFSKASKFWNTIANSDGTINSAYGYLIWANKSHGNSLFEGVMRTPWEWSKQSLIADKDTRQAILRFSLPEHAFKGVKDFTCTLHANFLIRDDKLNLSVVLRSNDWNKGILYDMPFFCSLLDKMLEELKSTYPTLTKGTYTHLAHSAHIYEKDEKIVKSMLGM